MYAEVKTHLVNCCSTNDKDLLHRVCSGQQVKGTLKAGAEVMGTFRCCAASKKRTMISLYQAQSGPF